jgi:hypothetical protein
MDLMGENQAAVALSVSCSSFCPYWAGSGSAVHVVLLLGGVAFEVPWAWHVRGCLPLFLGTTCGCHRLWFSSVFLSSCGEIIAVPVIGPRASYLQHVFVLHGGCFFDRCFAPSFVASSADTLPPAYSFFGGCFAAGVDGSH